MARRAFRAARLEREAAIYEELQALQGNVLPRFYGIAPGERRGYVYQDVGIALSEILTTVLEDKDGAYVPRLYHTIKRHIKALHAAGYSHGDIADRNVCVAVVGQSLRVRLIDLDHARKLDAVSSGKRKELEERDFGSLREIFSLRESDPEPPLQSDDSTEAL
jgi:tRNA A-37 threonylcarbamoyl transferase component Bud32